MRIGVTGASGYIGRALLRAADGHEVVVLGRRALPGHAWRPFDLDTAFDPAVLDGLDALVHLAADTTGAGHGRSEIAAAHALLDAAAARGLRIVFVSSQVAAEDAPSAYGRTKAAIEAPVLAAGGVVVRPGLVYGGAPLGLFGLLVALVRRSPVLPRLLPDPPVQPIHVDDLAQALLAALRPGIASRVYCMAGPPAGFSRVLQGIARIRLRARRLWLPVPVALLRAALAIAQPVLGPRLSPQRLDSLIAVPRVDAVADLAALGLVPRPLDDGFSRSGRHRRALLREASRLARGVLRARASGTLQRRYVRALEGSGLRAPSPALARGPVALIAAHDIPAERARRGSAAWRIGVVLRVAEADPALAERFVRRRGGRAGALFDVARAIAIEALVLPARLLASTRGARR